MGVFISIHSIMKSTSACDLVLEALLDGSLIGCTSIFKPKGHGHVAVSTKGPDK
jgi:hypothetical protein